MSKLEELIQQYCPDGVEYKPLGDYLSYEQPTKYLVVNTKYDDSYLTPVLTAGQSFILGYTNEKEGIFQASKDVPVIIFDDFTTSFHWVDFSFKVKSSAMKMLRPIDEKKALFRYLFYCMKNILYVPGDHTRQWIGTYSQFEIPVPPLPVQEEIVRILDNFTELQAELQAELQKRIQQYNYYRDNLLSDFTPEQEPKECTLEEITTDIYSGATPSKEKRDYWENGTIPWMSSGEVNLGQVYEVEGRITQLGYDKCSTRMVPEGSVVIALAGQGKTRGTVAILRTSVCTNQSLAALVPNPDIVSGEYLYYYLKTQYSKLREVSSGDGTRGGLNLKMLRSYKVIVPSLKTQTQIVAILDRFETLTNDLSQGLPAEIEKRKQQYEYYRDKLLTFKRK